MSPLHFARRFREKLVLFLAYRFFLASSRLAQILMFGVLYVFGACLVACFPVSRMGREEIRAFGSARQIKSLHHTILKAPLSQALEERRNRAFPRSQVLALAGKKLHALVQGRDGGSLQNPAGEIRVITHLHFPQFQALLPNPLPHRRAGKRRLLLWWVYLISGKSSDTLETYL